MLNSHKALYRLGSNKRSMMNSLFRVKIVYLLLSLISLSGYSAIFFVNANSNCTTCNGGSWATPYKDLQLALAAAATGDQIWVAKGTYKPSASNIDASFVLKSDVSIYGGFSGNETGFSQRNVKLNVTILSGDLLGNDDTTNINIANTTRFDNSVNVVKCTTAIAVTTILDGFTIMAGNADKQTTTGLTGGGLLFGANGCNPNIRNCMFKHNTSNFGGGAVEAGYDTKAQFDSCTFIKNVTNASSNGGGAIKCSSSAKPILRACQFLNNTATPTGTGTSGSGGAILVQNTSSPEFYACLFKNNTCTGTNQQGAAVYVVSSGNQASARFDNCVFSSNVANQGSVANLWQSVANFYNCVFYNHASSLIYVSGTNTVRPQVYNSIFYNNTGAENANATQAPAYYNSILQSAACPSGATCNCGVLYGTDPLFVDAANSNFRLSAGSPGINTGDKSVVTETKDIYGNTRVQNTFVDMGVAENASTALATVNVANGATVLSNGATAPLDFGSTAFGASVSKVITITNKGTGTLVLCNPTLTPNFSITGTYANSLAPNASTNITLVMDAQTTGAITGKLTFANNDPSNSTYVINLAANVGQAGMPLGNRGIYFSGKANSNVSGPSINASQITMMAWFKTEAIGLEQAVVSNAANQNSGERGIGLVVTTAGKVQMTIGNNGSRTFLNGVTSLEKNKWYHVACTYDNSGAKLYLNGVLENSSTGGAAVNATNLMRVGQLFTNGASKFTGEIDEVKIFNVVRSQTDIQGDMKDGSTITSGLLVYWNFEESSGTVATDVTVNTNDATVGTDCLWALRVTNTTDTDKSSTGTLRWAIAEANKDTDTDYIDFSIQQTDASVGAGTSSIIQTSLFPDISQPVVLDGYSAYGSSRNINAFSAGSNAQIRIRLEGFDTKSPNHILTLGANNSIIRGLSFTKGYSAINMTGNNNQIAGNFIGLDTDGNTAAGSAYAGLIVAGVSNTVGTLVAPSNMADLNVIAGSSRAISLTATGATVRYNYINTKSSGVVISSGSDGIALENTNTGVSIENNVIAANATSSAVRITGTASSNTTIKNNYIGVGANGSAPFTIGNGINVANASTKTRIVNNTVANGLTGIIVGNGFYGTIFSQNKIYCNTQSAINLNASGNNSKATPVITTASTTTIVGTCAVGDTIEIFRDTTCGTAPDQGKYYVGRVVATSTIWTYTGAFVNGQKITATASDGTNGTSAFAKASIVGAAVVSRPKSNQGLYFDGADDQVAFNPGFKFAGNSVYTLEAWVKVPDNGRPKNIFFQPSDITVTGSHAIAVFVENDGRISFANDKFSNGGWTVHSTVAKIPYKTWTHIAVASDGTGVKSIYINGVNQDNLVVTGSSGTGNAYLTATAPNTDWFIGKVGYYNNSAFEGEMDEVKIFNVFHKDVDVLKDMASTTADGAVAYWKLDESLGQAALDVTGTHNGKLGTDGSAEAIDPLWAYQVTNTSDVATTVGSLRWALTEAEKDTDTDYIDFSIQQDGTVSVIKPATEFIITKPVILDGYSAYGSSVNTNTLDKGLNTNLKLGLDLSSFSSSTPDVTPVQFINVDNSIVRGLSFFGLPYNGKGHQSMSFNNGKNNRVSGCWFGVRADGTAGTNMNGVYFIGGDGNILGYSGNKPDVSAANIIANCQYQGVNNSGSTNFVAQGNYFGLGTDGKSGANIGQWGILTSGNGSVIKNNVMGKCGDRAIRIMASNVTVQGNLLGVGADTTTAVPNSVGVYVESGTNNKIGGTDAGETNYIANNTIGVQVDGATTIKNKISGNNIYENTSWGISLTNGGNNLKAAAQITSITKSSVSGTCAVGDTVEVYNDSPQSGTTNQGRKYLGRASTTGTTWVYKGSFVIGDRITVTATDAANGTSAFSVAVTKTQYKPKIAKIIRKANTTQVYVNTNQAPEIASHTLLRYNKVSVQWDSVATQLYVSKSDTVISYVSLSACDSFLVKVYGIDSSGQKGALSDSMWVLPAVSSIDSALVAYYPFNGNATDQISGIKGVVLTGVSTTTDRFGKAGQAYLFDGVNGYINTNQSLSWTYDKSFTMSLWVQQSVKTKYQKNQVLLGKTYSTNGYEYFLGIDSTSTQFANWYNGGTGGVFNSKYKNTFVPDWRHLVVSYDATAHVLRQYENGILKITSNPIQASPNNILNGGPLLIGNGSPGAGIFGSLQMFKGKLDDIRIYNRALGPEDVGLLHDYQVDTLCKNSVFALSPYPVAGYTSYWMDKNHNIIKVNSIAGPHVAGTQYFMVVKNINSPCDSTIIVHEIAVGNNCTPKQVYATSGNKQATVHWKPINGVGEYTVYYGKDSTGVLQTVKVIDTVAVVSGLQNDSLYFFAVSAGGDTSRFDAAVPVVESGKARVFTTNTQVQVKPLVQNKTTYTITAWVKRKTSGSIYSEGNPALLFHFAVTADGKLMLNPNNGLGWDPRITNTTIPLNEWTFVAASFNNGLVNLIINDKVETFSNVKVSYTTLFAAIGMARENNYPFDGEIDEVSFWNKALSVDQLQKIKDKNIRGDEPGMIGLYHFDESKGSKVYDGSPYGNDGIWVNTPSSVVSKAMMPYQPSNFVSSVVDEGIELTWSKNIALDVKSIKIYRNNTAIIDTSGLLLRTIPYSSADTTYKDTTVLSCNTYYYKIVGLDSAGQVGMLSRDSSARYCIEPPIAFAATQVSNSSFVAHWKKVLGARSYYFELAKDTSFVPLVKQLSITDTLVAVNGLNTNTVYFYRVSAIRGDTSEPSNVKMTSTILPPGSGMGLFMKDTGYIELVNPIGGYNDTSYTYEAWFKAPLTHDSEKILFEGYSCAFGAVGDTITMFEYGDGLTFKSSFGFRTDSLTAGWHHLAIVASQSDGKSLLYVDGINRSSVSRFRSNPLNRLGGDGFSNSFGSVDELRVWNTARRQEQIQAHMCQKLRGDESGLIGYFRLDEGLGTMAENKASLSSIDGLMVNGPVWQNSGAALGDTSSSTYTANSLVFKDLSNTQKDQAALVLKTGSSKGLHLYKVRTAPNNVTKPLTDIDSLDTSRYFGSFVVDGKNTKLDFAYNYATNAKVGKKDTLLNFLERMDNASGSFKVADSTFLDLSKKTITAVGDFQRREYLLGFNVLPKIVFTTPTILTYGEDPLKLKADTNVTSVVTYTVSDTTIAKIVDGNKVIPLKDGTVTITASINKGKVKSTQTIKVSVPPFAIIGKKFVTELTNEAYELSPIVSGLSYTWTYSGVDVELEKGTLSNSLNVLFKKTATDGNLICTITNPLYKSAPIVVSKEIVVYHPGDVITKVNCDTVISNTKACSGNYLNGVQLQTIQNTNSGCSDGGYEDYTKSKQVASLYLGTAINASLHIGNNGVSQNQKNYVGIWLDYNNNGSFDDAGEFLLSDFSEDSVINLKNMVISTNVEYAGERRLRIRVRSTALVRNESCVSYNESGETEDYKVILMIPDHLEAPVLLTPNDDGKNDFFVIKGINANGEANKLTILDRLGTVLYTQDAYDNTWGGTDNNGKLLPKDTYYYHYVNGQNIIKGFFEIRY